MSGARDQQADLLQQAVESCRQENQELSSQWTNLDGKASAAITVSGVFLAAILAFIRELNASASDLEKGILTAALVLLIACTILALLVIRLRPVTAIPCGKPLVEMIDDLVAAADGTSDERLRNFARDHARLWQKANQTVSEAIASKARCLQAAHAMLFLAIVSAAAIAALKTWSATHG